ncbi:hypothetical protein A2524_03295 [Candidatus Wolfebacteria bacterium RIFOXYD12_FULL_48_21]|uniref:Uncharacterized protein n=1 Tax=Candidatus Wolfebacteria bacterium RIFOXYD1_FULL_48_65 TaxID=1802561 RepID=A0A1F8E4K7_9BACT|nr:MAG: hypothetical protein A2524_03295 [Candidatus Wolfebacteria bacterium RIFOXYD12_FULL_48_21]OGM95567.1 MAG: hypothetical protein A2610_01710 [Candidatus Wolfebacteria bacterium RIFOXYD1_FULL_48_65]OGM97848.1 MAG: hypothetical protein A2532_04745 [Candidatus Wolfebacteria bacterium RIFOXYD2_FULL_48_11]
MASMKMWGRMQFACGFGIFIERIFEFALTVFLLSLIFSLLAPQPANGGLYGVIPAPFVIPNAGPVSSTG